MRTKGFLSHVIKRNHLPSDPRSHGNPELPVKQLAKDLGTTREATGRRLNQHTIWDSNELDIVGKALGLTDMFGLCDYARALAEMNKNVPLSKTV